MLTGLRRKGAAAVKLEHAFTVPAPVDQAWATLLDIEGIAPCFPGATLTGVDGEEFTGTVKVKLGPVSLTYTGKGRFVERDDEEHRVVLDATGRDTKGNGTAGAGVVAHLEADGADSTRVVVETELKVTGRPAQFGRGVIQDVGSRIIDQFAGCLAARMVEPAAAADGGSAEADDGSAEAATASPAAGQDAPPSAAAAPGPVPSPSPSPARPRPVRPLRPMADVPEAAPAELDLGAAVLPALARRFGPPLAVAVLSALLTWWLLRRGPRRPA
jgi:carbon monoxide dehydrogenase subunit G